jgi:Cof subfamily protein (haloacid dehalogenase superfamily)
MYRLIALDIDGTLFNSQGMLPPAVRERLHHIHKLGVQIVLISGRNVPGVRRALDEIGLDLWFVSSGGALISSFRQDQILSQRFLKMVEAEIIIGLARKAGAGIFLELVDKLYWEGPVEYLDWLPSLHGLTIDITDDLIARLVPETLKLTVIHQSERLIDIENVMIEKGLEINVAYSGPRYLEVTAKGVTKGAALQKLAEFLEVPLSKTLAVGDGENDISMISLAGLGVAMGNSPEKVKMAADLIIPSNDEDGLLTALRLIEECYEAG